MTEYSLTECAALLSVTHKTAARWFAEIEPGSRPYQPQVKTYTREQLEAIAKEHGRELTDSLPVTGIAEASVARATIEELTRRVAALEARLAHEQARPRGPIIPTPRLAPSESPLVKPHEASGLPGSARGNAKWVEQHGGPGQSWVREWPDVREWRSVEDAIASVRRKRGWEGWTPTDWTPEAKED